MHSSFSLNQSLAHLWISAMPPYGRFPIWSCTVWAGVPVCGKPLTQGLPAAWYHRACRKCWTWIPQARWIGTCALTGRHRRPPSDLPQWRLSRCGVDQKGARWDPGKLGNKAPHLGQVGVSEKAVSVLSRSEMMADLSSMLEKLELIWGFGFQALSNKNPWPGTLEMPFFPFAYKIF